MPRAILDLMNKDDLALVKAEWRIGFGYVPGKDNEGLVSRTVGSPARLIDYDDSDWDKCEDLTQFISRGFTFAWYRIKVTIPEYLGDQSLKGMRCLIETCVDDYGEVWVDGECDRERGSIQGFNVPQRVKINEELQPGSLHTIAILAANGPLASPGGAVFLRYANLCFEWGGRPVDKKYGR